MTVSVNVHFSGGLELLFANQRNHQVYLPPLVPKTNATVNVKGADAEQKPADVNFLIHYLRDYLLKERVELFMENGTVRPGILVLINDTDWELEEEGDYLLKDGDEIAFISTLHGG